MSAVANPFLQDRADNTAVERCLDELNAFFEILESMDWIPRTRDQRVAVETQMQRWKKAQRALMERRLPWQ